MLHGIRRKGTAYLKISFKRLSYIRVKFPCLAKILGSNKKTARTVLSQEGETSKLVEWEDPHNCEERTVQLEQDPCRRPLVSVVEIPAGLV
jgi:hypothetical protein